MARRAKDTRRPLFRLMVSVPTDWQPYLDGIDPASRAGAVRRLIQFALDRGALAALGYVPPPPTDPDALAQLATLDSLASGSVTAEQPRTPAASTQAQRFDPAAAYAALGALDAPAPRPDALAQLFDPLAPTTAQPEPIPTNGQ